MSDLRQRIFNTIKESHLASFATITEDGKPWARYVTPHASEDLTLRFSTGTTSRKVVPESCMKRRKDAI